MTTQTRLLLLVLICMTALGGCAAKTTPAHWQHPTLAKELWEDEIGVCRRDARREVEREAGMPASGPVSDNLPGGTSVYRSNMTRFELQRLQHRTFERCMRRKGFQPLLKK